MHNNETIYLKEKYWILNDKSMLHASYKCIFVNQLHFVTTNISFINLHACFDNAAQFYCNTLQQFYTVISQYVPVVLHDTLNLLILIKIKRTRAPYPIGLVHFTLIKLHVTINRSINQKWN